MNRAQSILVAIDFSCCSEDAFRKAARIAGWNRAALEAIYVIDVPSYPPVQHPLIPFPLPTQSDLVREAWLLWKEFAVDCEAKADAKFRVLMGNPRAQILRAVESVKPDLLVVGATSHSDRCRGIGTTASALIRKADTKLLLVREGQRRPFATVAACVDFSATSLEVVDQAVRITAQDQAQLHIVHLYDEPWHGLRPQHVVAANLPEFSARMSQAVVEKLRAFCRPLISEVNAMKAQFHGIQYNHHWEGHGPGISGFLRQHVIELAVFGVRSTWNVRDFVVGSTAERVCRDAGTSILTIRPARRAEMADATTG